MRPRTLQTGWTAVDEYFNALLIPSDPVLEATLLSSEAAGLPPHNVAPNQGMLLQLLARMLGARRALEIGTLGGYSTIFLARGLPEDGRLISLELNPGNAEIARGNIERAGLSSAVEIRVGPAVESLHALVEAGAEPFDLIFIDADKPSNPAYFALALRLAHAGTAIVVDNVVRDGAVLDPAGDANVQGVRQLCDLIAEEPRVTATALQTVGSKGYDGFILALVNA